VAEQRQRSDIVVGGRSVHEILHCLQNGQAQVLRGQVGRSLQGVCFKGLIGISFR
jgi:hypothetical protein